MIAEPEGNVGIIVRSPGLSENAILDVKETDMKKIVFAAIAASTALAALSPAVAAEDCGPGGHRGPYGHCRPNRGPAFGPGPVVVGTYYENRGWWDGHRYWRHRDRWHGGWRYR